MISYIILFISSYFFISSKSKNIKDFNYAALTSSALLSYILLGFISLILVFSRINLSAIYLDILSLILLSLILASSIGPIIHPDSTDYHVGYIYQYFLRGGFFTDGGLHQGLLGIGD